MKLPQTSIIFARNISHHIPNFLIDFAQILPLLLPQIFYCFCPNFQLLLPEVPIAFDRILGKAMGNSGKSNGKICAKAMRKAAAYISGKNYCFSPNFRLLLPEFPTAFPRIFRFNFFFWGGGGHTQFWSVLNPESAAAPNPASAENLAERFRGT